MSSVALGAMLMVAAPANAAFPTSLVSTCAGIQIAPGNLIGIGGLPLIGATVNLSVLNTLGQLVGPSDACNTTADSYQLDTPAGISIGGNRITGLGANGQDATAGEINSIAFGNSASTLTTALGAVAIGRTATVNGAGGVALGQNAVAGTAGNALLVNQIAIGNGASAPSSNSIAIGSGASATAANSVAIGTGSATFGRGANINYTAPGVVGLQNSVGTVAVGTPGATRQIINVAPGQVATDAVNVAQLNGLAGNAIQYDAVAGVRTNTATLAGGVSGPVRITNLAAGDVTAGSSDAVNGAQLFGTNANVTANTVAIQANAAGIATNTANIATNTAGIATNTAGIATNAANIATNTAGISANTGLIATNTLSISALNNGTAGIVQQDLGAPNNTPIRVGAATGGTIVSFNGTDGNRRLTDVAAGTAATDAVNRGQLDAVSAQSANAVLYDTDALGVRTNRATLVGAPGTPAPVTLANVAAGTLSATSDEAVNGAQLFATNTQVAANTDNITTNTTNLGNLTTGINNGTVGLVQQAGGLPDGVITVGAGTGGTVVNVGGTGGTRTISGVTAGVAATDAANVGQVQAVNALATNSVQYDTLAGVKTNSITLAGGVAGVPVTVTNVAPAALNALSTDAVNGSQLFATNTQVTANTDNITTNTTNLGNLTTGINNGTVGLVQQAGGLPDGVITVGAGTGGTVVNVGGTGGTRIISGVTAGVAATDAVNVSQLGTVGTVAANSVQYDTLAGVKTNSITLAGGVAGVPVTVTNVAPAALNALSTDAVNGSQLFATNARVDTNTADIVTANAGIAANTGLIAANTVSITALNNGTAGIVQQDVAGPSSTPIRVGAATGGTIVSFAGTDGNRRLTDVANGTAATDAVNRGQLDAVGAQSANAVLYDVDAQGVRTNRATLVGTPGQAAPVTLANVAAGTLSATSDEAVNGAQLFATNTQVTTNTTDIATNTTNLGNLTTNINNGTVGLVQQVGGLPGGIITVGAATGGTVVNVAGTDGTRTISGVTAGVAATDAANVGQVQAVNALATNAVQYDAVGGVRTNTVTLAGGVPGPVTITNVAPAALTATSTDAVNGAQLFATNAQVTTNTADIQTNTTNIAGNTTAITNLTTSINNGSVGLVQQTGGSPGAGQITVGGNTGGTSVTIAGTDGNRTLTGLAAGLGASDAATVGQLAQVTGGAFNAVNYDTDANGGRLDSITLAGGTPGAPVRIGNVAAGTLAAGSTDAVNGDQLAATNANVAANTTGLAATNVNVTNNTNAITAINNGAAGAFRSNNTAGAAAPSATGANATAGGFGATATASRAVAIGNGATATGANSVALGAGSSDGGAANVVSVGSVGAERRLTNVGPAVSGTDAVNLTQLQAVQSQFGAATTGLQNQINDLSFDVRRVRRDANAATAGALAVAALPQAFTPGAGMVGGGIGEWHGQVAFAVGASKIIGDQTVVKAGASINTHGSGGFNAGVGYQF